MTLNLRWLFQLTLAATAPCAVLGDPPALTNDFGFDVEAYGFHPVQRFRSIGLEAPLLNVLKSSPKCESELYTMMSPRGGFVAQPQITILDSEGHLIWTTPWRDQQLYNLMVQEYKGEKYITFWGGDDTVGGHGAGQAFMLDKNYELFKTIEAANGRDADLHDFRITKEGTALLTVYELYDRDLREVGQDKEGPVWDCLVQEVDLESGELLFEWRAMMYYPLSASFKEYDEGLDGSGWDFFHLNSVDKDSRGNYLISSRYTHSLTYIDGQSGEVIWIFGGKMNMFDDLSNGTATSFRYQHDARWSPDEKTITLFDNGIADMPPDAGYLPTRGLRVQLDEANMTARVVTEYLHPHHFGAKSQGSLQQLPNGNVVLGYGDSAAFTEFSYDGELLCDTHFAPESRYMWSDVQSYRVYKYEWHAWPTNKPDAVLAQGADFEWAAFVSWNGATEIRSWVLQGSKSLNDPDDIYNRTVEHWEDLETVLKTGFETAVKLKYWYPPYLRFVAKDSRSKVLGISAPLNGTEVGTPWATGDASVLDEHGNELQGLLFAFCLFTSIGMVGRMIYNQWFSRRRRRWLPRWS